MKSLARLEENQDLSKEEMRLALEEVFAGNPQAGVFLQKLHAKGETSEELLGFLEVLREKMIPIPAEDVFDIVGTGGDGMRTVNISTATAFILAAAGVRVLKHGNRSATSKAGSFDLLEKMGIQIDMDKQKMVRSLNRTGLAFAFAPLFHPALKKVKDLRKSLGTPTTFNLVGPLLHPAKAKKMMIGVYKKELLPLFACVLQKMGVERALVYHGSGMDEITTIGKTNGFEVTKDAIIPVSIDPEKLGFSLGKLEDLQGNDVSENEEKIRKALSGEEGTLKDTLLLNAGVGIYLDGKASTILEGIALAREALLKSLPKIEEFKEFSKQDILQELIENKEKETKGLETKKQKRTSSLSFQSALEEKGLSLIAEIKRASPSRGKMAEIDSPKKLAQKYVEKGASAISVLTDKYGFSGKKEDLIAVKEAVSVPVLRKDFIIKEEQIYESIEMGADAILLIVAALKKRTKEFVKLAKEANIDALVEVHDEEELKIALDAGAEIIGVNNRDLKTFTTDIQTSLDLIGKIPRGKIAVSESGISEEQHKTLKEVGFDAILVGASLIYEMGAS